VDLSDAGAPKINGHLLGIWFDTTSSPSPVHMWGMRGEDVRVYRSTDRGDTWTMVRKAKQDEAATLRDAPRAKPAAVKRALDAFLTSSGGYFGGFVTDADSGAKVAAIDTGSDVLIVDPDHQSTFYVATKEGVHKSVDGGKTWRKASAGL
jgi:hypothetical protein